jgi:hypothetical protein
MPELPILSSNTRSYTGYNAFDNDAFNRKELADKLTTYLERLRDGAVVAIDAPWGEGKSWFGRNWAKQLESEEYKVIYIDTFEQDYVEDPFMLITSEILDTIEDGIELKEELKKGAIEVGKALLPVAGKAIVNVVGKVLLASPNLTEEVQEAISGGTSSIVEMTSEFIKENLESYGQDKLAMTEFKIKLTKYAQSQDKPIVIFVDELDRCKPTFAVNLVERIKHLFDVPNVVFVLLLNREQLEKAVKGVYGSETDASAYLGKFVNFFFSLPKNYSKTNHRAGERIEKFIKSTMIKYEFQVHKDNESFILYLELWSTYFNLSLRDIEKVIAMYAFAYPTGELTWIIVYFIVLKIKEPNLFNRLVINEMEAHKEAKKLIEKFIEYDKKQKNNLSNDRVLTLYHEWHEAHINGFSKLGDSLNELTIRSLWGNKKDWLETLLKKIDIDIER